MVKHSPGPWRIGDAGFTVFGPPNGTPSPETIANVKRKTNTRLIAAAPDLLAALKNLASAFEGSDGRVQKALCAIAKAEGKQ